MARKESIKDVDKDTQCGIGAFRPSWLQPFANEKSFIGVFSALSLISWSLYTVFVSQISNIEKAFGLSSSETGRLLTLWEIGYLVCTSLTGYLAPRAHIPRVLGFATILYGFSAFVNILPHFVAFSSDVATLSDTNSTDSKTNAFENSLCKNRTFVSGIEDGDGNNVEANLSGSSKRTLAYTLFVIANILQGAAKGPCYPYSAQYVDDNGSKQNTGFYMGIIAAIAIFGLSIGYGIGSLVSNVHVTLSEVSISPSDPRFISAWWLGMACVGVLSFLISFPMLMLPKRVSNKHTEARNVATGRKPRSNVRGEFKEVTKALFEVVKSPIYITMLFACSFQALSGAAFFGFEPKYMETQFTIPSWKVNIIVGAASISSFSIGSLVGGYLTKRFKFTPVFIIVFIILMSIIDIIIVVILFFVGCSQPEIIKSAPGVYDSPCDCVDSQFLPICGSDGQSWFSPCHAGCTVGTLTEFSNCSQIEGGQAAIELCPSDCKTLWIYVVLRFVHNMVDAISSVPVFIVLLRSAGEERKSMAIGLSAAVTSVVAWLPGPSIGGVIIDSACVVWKGAASNSGGKYCGFYDIDAQRYRIHGVILGFRVISVILMTVSLFFARNLKKWDVDKEDAVVELEVGDCLMVTNGDESAVHLTKVTEENGQLDRTEVNEDTETVFNDQINGDTI